MAGLGSSVALPAALLRDRDRGGRRGAGAAIEAHPAVDLHDVDPRGPPVAQVLRDLEERAPPAHAEGARNGAERGEVVGRRLGGALLQLFGRDDAGRGHDDRVGEPPLVAKPTLDRQATRARMQDLDADEAALLRLREQPPDLPPGEAQRLPDLVLRLVLFVVELGRPDREQLVDLVHAPPSDLASSVGTSGAHRQHSRAILLI